jgi:CDGSH-type Zn-finger protein/uncharacterized Fe-S cluster protein YjdI
VAKKIHTYEGADIDVTWNGALCIHVGECGRAVGDLFVGGRDPWCSPDVSALEDVIAVIERCPTGALSYALKDGTAPEMAPATNTGIVANNGPIYLTGDLQIDGATEATPGVATRVALCRCGKSKNKPFCDNTHEGIGFRDRGAIGDSGTAIEAKGGPLKISRIPNGPFMVEGALTLHAGSGRAAWTGDKLWMCRCGASKNKPFCDGSHTAAGFVAE